MKHCKTHSLLQPPPNWASLLQRLSLPSFLCQPPLFLVYQTENPSILPSCVAIFRSWLSPSWPPRRKSQDPLSRMPPQRLPPCRPRLLADSHRRQSRSLTDSACQCRATNLRDLLNPLLLPPHQPPPFRRSLLQPARHDDGDAGWRIYGFLHLGCIISSAMVVTDLWLSGGKDRRRGWGGGGTWWWWYVVGRWAGSVGGCWRGWVVEGGGVGGGSMEERATKNRRWGEKRTMKLLSWMNNFGVSIH